MIFKLLVLSLIGLSARAATEAPKFSDSEIQQFIVDIKKQKKIPEKAVDMAFDFYLKNRMTVGGLKDRSCIDKKEYQIRVAKDPKLKKSDLHQGIKNEDCVCIVDYTMTKEKQRGHCIFLNKTQSPKIESFLTAHGSGSQEKNGIPVTFTNKTTSTGTTLSGFHITAPETYGFSGSAVAFGKYSSTGLGLYGVEESNWTAAQVGKVTHGAPYVTDNPVHTGRSHGCPAMTVENAKRILPLCKGGAVWLNYTTATAGKLSKEPEPCRHDY